MNPKILIVDDDAVVLNMVHTNFVEEGYRVIEGFDGSMALQLAHKEQPDLIVMDVNMPMTNGLKALEYLRESKETAAIPVIFLTASESKYVYPAIESVPRVAYIKKPVDLESLNSLVRQFLEKYGSSQAA
jgi:CheY-like chemotaxis protein